MKAYKNKAKCGFNCTKRAKWVALKGHGKQYACPEHKHRIEHLPSPEVESPDPYLTEADYQTWMRLQELI